MQEVIKVTELTKSYGSLAAVSSLSLSVPRGTVFGLIGPNGAGKSTTIECILGTKKADAGTVRILGADPRSDRKKLFEKTGVQFQDSNYQEQITVSELCELTASLYEKPADPFGLLARFGIADKKKSLVKDLSGGQRQRLFIVLALIPDPDVVFLDELTTGLDAKARREVWNILSGLKKRGLTIFLTSHFMDEVEALCDRICILKEGKSVFYGTVSEAVEKSPYGKFEDAYLWYTNEEDMYNENI
ncbi:ABC transporter ATP-binding protein [[Clostridium] hylemonae]|nr:ABC transporter ATP-binding protein [[Clostridium] hylemonae]QEK19043.1 Daunorubicin/doxorubicin resistance ATP-binding protein DrrA [[Clostridium] hylemonae DSM 15053]